MKRINKILFILVVALIGFVGIKNVNAETIVSPQASCGDFPKDGDSLITSCSSSGDESSLFDVTLKTWYKGEIGESNSENPGTNIGTTGVYESGYQYYLELGFKSKAGNEFIGDPSFHIIGLSDGTIRTVSDGEYIVVFEFTVHHIISFETYGGTPIEDIVVTDWCTFDMPDDPIKDGYTFMGWYEDSNFKDQYWPSCVEESMTLYARYVDNNKIINSININLIAPTIGQVITSGSHVDPEWGAVIFDQDPRPIATAPNDANYVVDSTAWVQGVCDYENESYLCDEFFEGEIEEDTYYYAEISIEANEDYAMFADDLTIKVNAEKPAEVFAVYDGTYTRFIAKIKSQETIGYLSNYDFGTYATGYGWIDHSSIPFTINGEYSVDPDRLTSSISGPDYDKFNVVVMNNYAVMNGPGTWSDNSPVSAQPITDLEPGTYNATLTLKYDEDNDGIYEIEFGSATLTFKVIENVTQINRIDITSDTTEVFAGDLQAYTVSTTTNHISIEEFGNNTSWTQNTLADKTNWRGFGADPVVATVGDTHYGLRLCINHDNGYVFDENISIFFNGEEITNKGLTWFNTSFDWGGYLYIDLGVAKQVNINSATVSGVVNQTYNGSKQRQDKLIVKIGDKVLVKDIDYTVGYSSLINAGTITITIKGKGNYEGTITKTFTRNKAKNPLTVKAYNKTVYYSKVKNAAQVVKPIYLSNTKNAGTISYEKLSGSSAKLLLNKTTGKVTVKKGIKKGKYMIKIKVKAAGTTNYKSTYAIRTIYVTVK